MATIYKVEIVSHWINYDKESFKAIIKKALEDAEINEFTVEVETRS
jgi:hypothetical protein